MDRAVIHLNVADFAASVERLVDARLRGRPVIVAPEGGRAAVYDMSEEAFRAGVRKGMMLARALRICRGAAVLPPRKARYEQAMAAVCRLALPFSPLVESGGDDGHLFVDVTASGRCFGPPVDMAWRMQREARRLLGLDPIWAVAPNKLTAKAATRTVKPAGEAVVGAGEEADFLAPLPLGLLPGVTPSDLVRFRDFNLDRVADAQALDFEQMQVAFGPRGRIFHETRPGRRPLAGGACGPTAAPGRGGPRLRGRHQRRAGPGRGRSTASWRPPGLRCGSGAWRPGGSGSPSTTPTGSGGSAGGRPAWGRPTTRPSMPWPGRPSNSPGSGGSGSATCASSATGWSSLRGRWACLTTAAVKNRRAWASALDAVRQRFGRDAVRVGRTLAA